MGNDEKISVTVGLLNGAKYFTFTKEEWLRFNMELYEPDYPFIEIPRTGMIFNKNQIVYVNHRAGEVIDNQSL